MNVPSSAATTVREPDLLRIHRVRYQPLPYLDERNVKYLS